jgi:hypothetical protein
MRSLIATSLLVLALAGGAPAPAHAQAARTGPCEVITFSWEFGITNQGVIATRAGQPCEGQVSPGRVRYIERVEVLRGPANGIVGMSGTRRFAYAPRPGFTGRDAFVIRVHGEDRGVRQSALIEVEVAVR